MQMGIVYQLFGKIIYKLNACELFIFESELLNFIEQELIQYFKKQFNINHTFKARQLNKEETMQDKHFLRCIVNDILASGEYTLEGIAYYTQVHEDVIYDIISGKCNHPSITIYKKIIGLHSTIRKELYQQVVKKIIDNNTQEKDDKKDKK